MKAVYKTPGVYREEVFFQPEVRLLTGVPGFVGFAEAIASEELPTVVLLHRKEEFTDNLKALANGYLRDAVLGFFENGGTRCYVALGNTNQNRETALTEAIASLGAFSDLDLSAVPDAMLLSQDATIRIQQTAIQHCTHHGDRLAILDALPNRTVLTVLEQGKQIRTNQQEPLNAALYYPWLKNTRGRLVPPCGHVAGILAFSDRTRGVFKAPANEIVQDALALEISINNSVQDRLNPEGINCLRSFTGRGIRLWGARTLSRDRNWRYINVRRIFLTLVRWIDLNMQWVTFEPNSPQFWIAIQRELNTYLTQLWQTGALQGQIPEQAFYVKCDAETNPPEIREIGQASAEIGLAINSPAEFIIVRITQRSGSNQVTVESVTVTPP
jgi:hypothetical protein